MNKRLLSTIAILTVAALPMVVGCTSTYAVHLRDSKTQAPMVNTSVRVLSVPEIYSFLDPRHYLSGCGKRYSAQGKTDSQGRMVFKMPDDLGIASVSVAECWTVKGPSSEWIPMMTAEEIASGVPADQLKNMGGRPQVKIQKK